MATLQKNDQFNLINLCVIIVCLYMRNTVFYKTINLIRFFVLAIVIILANW